MGLVRAALGAISGTLADQWKEFFYCDSLNQDILMTRGEKTGRRTFFQYERERQHYFQWFGHRCGRRPVHDDRGTGKSGRGLCRAG